MVCTVIHIVIIIVEKLCCRKYFTRLIFVALCDYENFLTTKISRFTVYQWVKSFGPSLCNFECFSGQGNSEQERFAEVREDLDLLGPILDRLLMPHVNSKP